MPPLGLLYIASYLEKHGVDVEVIDPLMPGNEEYVSESRFTGITCMSNQFTKVKQIAKEVKENNPDTIIVVGGVHPTVATEEVISEPNIDVAVVGEGEVAMLKIVRDKIKRGVVHGKMIQNLDEIPFPARHLIDMEWYMKRDTVVPFTWCRASTVMTSRGCPFSCAFCINSKHKMFGKKVRYHSAWHVRWDVAQLFLEYNAEGIHFVDDTFTLNKKRLFEICGYLKPLDLKWFAQARVGTVNIEMLTRMKESGCVSLGVGVESGSERVLRELNKPIKIEDTVKFFEMCKEVGIMTLANIIIGCPEEIREDIELTGKLLERIKPDFTEIWHLTPYRGTVIYDRAMENGWIKSDSLTTDEPQMEINFTLEELNEIRDGLVSKHNPKFKILKPYLKNKHFVYDMLRVLAHKPSLVTRGVERWKEEASGIL